MHGGKETQSIKLCRLD